MAIDRQFGGVDAGLGVGHHAGTQEQSSTGDALAARHFSGGAGSLRSREFVAHPGRNFRAIKEHKNASELDIRIR